MIVGFIECLLDAKPSGESFMDVDSAEPFYEENRVQVG